MQGSCLCGKIKFKLLQPPQKLTVCHCQMCKQSTGSVLGAFYAVPDKFLNVIQGSEFIKIYNSSEWASRSFCSECGSTLEYIYHADLSLHHVAVGLFENTSISPNVHYYVSNKCDWYHISDDGIQHQTYQS